MSELTATERTVKVPEVRISVVSREVAVNALDGLAAAGISRTEALRQIREAYPDLNPFSVYVPLCSIRRIRRLG